MLLQLQAELAQVRQQQTQDRVSLQATLDAQAAHIRELQRVLPNQHRENSSTKLAEPARVQEIDDSHEEELKNEDWLSEISHLYSA